MGPGQEILIGPPRRDCLIAIRVGLERAGFADADIGRLFRGERGQLRAQLLQMQAPRPSRPNASGAHRLFARSWRRSARARSAPEPGW